MKTLTQAKEFLAANDVDADDLEIAHSPRKEMDGYYSELTVYKGDKVLTEITKVDYSDVTTRTYELFEVLDEEEELYSEIVKFDEVDSAIEALLS